MYRSKNRYLHAPHSTQNRCYQFSRKFICISIVICPNSAKYFTVSGVLPSNQHYHRQFGLPKPPQRPLPTTSLLSNPKRQIHQFNDLSHVTDFKYLCEAIVANSKCNFIGTFPRRGGLNAFLLHAWIYWRFWREGRWPTSQYLFAAANFPPNFICKFDSD